MAQKCNAMLKFLSVSVFFNSTTGFPCPSPLCWFYSASQWCSWAVTSTPQKTGLMLSSRSMAGVTTPPPTVRGPSSSLTSREKASKRLLTGGQGSTQLVGCFQIKWKVFFFLTNNKQIIRIHSQKNKVGERLKCLDETLKMTSFWCECLCCAFKLLTGQSSFSQLSQ